MRVFVFLFFLLVFSVTYAQSQTIVFDKVIHDFKLIEEERGVVITEFIFTNNRNKNIK